MQVAPVPSEVSSASKTGLPPEGNAPSQAVNSSESGQHTPRKSYYSQGELDDFIYRPVPANAVVGLVLALFSSLGIFIWLILPLTLVAMVVSGFAWFTISKSKGGYGGNWVAASGFVLSILFLLGGIGFQSYLYQTEVPEGYARLSFSRDVSAKDLITHADGTSTPDPDILALEGTKVFLKGYIYQTGQVDNLGSFLLVKDNQDCCFGGQPKLTDRLGVVMNDGKTISYKAGKVAVAGTFRLNPHFTEDVGQEPLYIIEADHFSSRISEF